MRADTADRAGDPNVDNPYLIGPYAPLRVERSLDELAVVGTIPDDLNGVYVRNGPSAKRAPRGRYHWFDGDGMLHAIRLAGGRASYRNRWVQTQHLAREDEADSALWTGLLHSVADNPPDAPYKDTSNTDVVAWGGEVVTSWYICGLPYRVDPITLDTRGVHAFGADRPRRLSAHAKVDYQTGELVFFDYGPKPELSYGVASSDQAIDHCAKIPLPGPRLPHDMAITQRYSILMDLPLFPTEEAIRQRRWRPAFHRDTPTRFAVLPRRGDASSVRWFEAEPCYIYHTVNAWEDGDDIVMVAYRFDDPIPAPDHERDGAWARVMANLRLNVRLYQWRFNLRTGDTRERELDDRNSEFPCINAGRCGRPTRFAYSMAIADAPTLLFEGLIKYDTDTGACQSYSFGPGRFGSEAAFAPRHGGIDSHGDEDDGYVITLVRDMREDRAELLIFDGRDITTGPLAQVVIPVSIPLGFHACWVPGQTLTQPGG